MSRRPTCCGKASFEPLEEDKGSISDSRVEFCAVESIGDEEGKFPVDRAGRCT